MSNARHVRRWHRWQRASISTVARARKSRRDRNESEVRVTDDYSMTYVCIATSMESDLSSIAAKHPSIARQLDSYVLRLLQYVGRTSGVLGEIHLPPQMWGPTVFTRPWDAVSAAKGKAILAALTDAGIVVNGPATVPKWLRKFEDSSRDESRDGSRDRSRDPFGTCPSTSASGTASASGTSIPPPPPKPGGEPPSGGREPGEPHGRSLRPRDRERYGRVLEYVIRCGVTRRQPVGRSIPVALERRAELQEGRADDDEIAERLGADYAWVTAERLSRWKDGAA